MKFDVIDTLTAFDELAGDWREVFAASTQCGNIFTSYEWHRAYLRHFWSNTGHSGSELAIVVGRQRGKAQVICPLIVEQQFGARVLRWIGDPVSQYGDAVVRDTKDQARMVSEALRFVARKKNADALVLGRLREDGAAADAIKLSRYEVLKSQTAPFTNLAGYASVDQYVASQTSNRRKQHRRLWRRLEDHAPVKFETLRPGDEAVKRTCQALSLKAQMLAESGTFSRAFADDRFSTFFKDLAANKDADFGFLMSVITCGDQLIAAEIGFESHKNYIAHVGVYNPEFRRFAPGRLQIEQTIKSCLESGVQRYDFLPPDSDYKRAWSTGSVNVIDVCVPLTSTGQILCSMLKAGAIVTETLKKKLPAPLMRYAARLALAGTGK